MNILKNTKALIALSVVVAAIGGSQVYACRDTFAALAHEKTETKSVAKKDLKKRSVLRLRRSQVLKARQLRRHLFPNLQAALLKVHRLQAQAAMLKVLLRQRRKLKRQRSSLRKRRRLRRHRLKRRRLSPFFTATGSNERILPERTFISDQKLQRYGFGSGRRQRLCLDISSELLFV